MSNFKFLLSEPGVASFTDVAIAAEKILHIDPAACILNCRRLMVYYEADMLNEKGELNVDKFSNKHI